MKEQPIYSSVLRAEGVGDLVLDCVDGDTKEELRKHVNDYKKYIDSAKAAMPKPQAAPKQAMKKTKCADKDMTMVALMKNYLPDVDGCTVSQETEWHARFKVTYPSLLPPGFTGRCYDESCPNSKRAAAQYCLSWAWAEHVHKFPEIECPWDFAW